jgi:hypothetical protein
MEGVDDMTCEDITMKKDIAMGQITSQDFETTFEAP